MNDTSLLRKLEGLPDAWEVAGRSEDASIGDRQGAGHRLLEAVWRVTFLVGDHCSPPPVRLSCPHTPGVPCAELSRCGRARNPTTPALIHFSQKSATGVLN